VSASAVGPDGVIAPGLPLNLTLPGNFADSDALGGNSALATLESLITADQATFELTGMIDLEDPGFSGIGEAAVVFTTDTPLRYTLEAQTTGFRFSASFSDGIDLQTFFDPGAPGGVGGNVPLGGFAALGVIAPGMHTIDFRLIAEPLRPETTAADLAGSVRLVLTPMTTVPEPGTLAILAMLVAGFHHRRRRLGD
jgi:hypothetical protein